MNFRQDIQALRGIAILLVVLYHAKIFPIDAGYLGVDIFFVISGYLITGLIARAIIKQEFSFSEFYFRRAKRLLPVAYVTFFLTAFFSLALLSVSELNDFLKQLIGAVTFTGNIVLWLQAGYFEGNAALKPLLHVWSLSIEEQYYLLIPLALVLIPKKYWLSSAVLFAIVSLALCLMLVPLRHAAAFYLLPTRAWELAFGSIAALLALTSPPRLLIYAFWPALISLVVIPIFPLGGRHPGADAIVVCFATALVILRQHPTIWSCRLTQVFSVLGNFSYSLYLVHWPVFAFLNNLYLDEPPRAVRVIAGAASVLLAYILFRLVELPIRQKKILFSWKGVGVIFFTSFILLLTPLIATKVMGLYLGVDTQSRYVKSSFFDSSCNLEKNLPPQAGCRTSPSPKILVWGDSIASHLIPGIHATTGSSLEMAARAVCGPFVGIAPISNRGFSREWAIDCLEFNKSVLNYLAAEKSIEVVVMSSAFGQYLGSSLWGHGQNFVTLESTGNSFSEHKPSIDLAVTTMVNTIVKVRALGKRVVIVAPPPSSGIDMSRCLDRKRMGKPVLGVKNENCDIDLMDWHRNQAEVLVFLSRIQTEADVPVISFDSVLCSELGCKVELDGVSIFRDSIHFSYDGSIAVAKKNWLGRMLESVAK